MVPSGTGAALAQGRSRIGLSGSDTLKQPVASHRHREACSVQSNSIRCCSYLCRHVTHRGVTDQIPLAFVGQFGACVVGGVIGHILYLSIGVLITSILLSREAVGDPGRHIAIAFGVSSGDRIQIHLGVSPLVPVTDPLDSDKEKLVTWSEWVDGHSQLHDSSGNPIQLERLGTSDPMVGKQAAGAPEFVLWAEVTICQSYT